ncbi:hypothetical protein MNB_SV-3-1037 [hydrothermal vent metagenome]|uniref:Uncharacterized protein n=1 Tax=hydrothermal vent metagenome TaxID=652676 RepID=A0A1W1C5B5_9ZZZZ
MKHLEKDKLQSLLDIIGSNPSLQIAHFTKESSLLTQMLSEYCNQREYLYQINCTDLVSFGEMKKNIKNNKNIQIKNIPLERKAYMIQGKQYDFLFVTTPIENDMKSDFLRKAHTIICNAGNIIIFINKRNKEERYHWITLLEEHDYVATSTIDDLFEEYDIIISKKMHGWGSK